MVGKNILFGHSIDCFIFSGFGRIGQTTQMAGIYSGIVAQFLSSTAACFDRIHCKMVLELRSSEENHL
jgi:hypothetical protein